MINLQRITTVDEVIKYWPFIQAGLNEVRKDCKNVPEYFNDDYYFKNFINVVKRSRDEQIAVVILSEVGHPLGLAMGYKVPARFQPKTFHFFYVHVAKGHANLLKLMVTHIKEWGKQLKYEQCTTQSFRFSGAAFRFFEKQLGFQRSSINFYQKL